jgi:hypothetical protein
LAFVRKRECAIKDCFPAVRAPNFGGKPPHVCEGDIEAAHVRGSQTGGIGMKPGDNFSIPLCSKAHREQHQIGEAAFQKRYGFDMMKMAADLWQADTYHRRKHELAHP